MDTMVERRMFERIERDFAGQYSTEDSQTGGEFKGLNLSGGGLLVCADKKFPEGRALDLMLTSDYVKNPIRTSGQIVWQKEVGSGKWQAGVKFYRPNLIGLARLINPSCF